jgi:flagellar basal-body rod modification protein FlgD
MPSMVTPAVIRKLVGETNRIGGTTLMDRLDKIAAAHPGRTHGGLIQDKTFNSRQSGQGVKMTPIVPTSSYNSTSGVNNSSSNSSSDTSSTSSVDKLANENTFLQLFVAQLKNQDPMNPADGTQFVSQLAQFSELEQVINIGQNVSAIRQGVNPAPEPTGDTTGQSLSQSADKMSGS